MTSNERLNKSGFFVDDVPLRVCKNLVSKYHYAKGGSNTATFRHGLFRRGEPLDCLGIAWWIPPTRSAAEASWNGDWRRVITLSRLVLVPEAPRNSASFLISASIGMIRRDGRFLCLLTYADEYANHTGQIYKATNWEYLGLTEGEKTYIDDEGRIVARKAGPVTRTMSDMEHMGFRNAGSFRKHKFRIILPEPKNKSPRRQMLLEGV